MTDDDNKPIRVSFNVPHNWCPAFYDDLKAAGRYYRAGVVRSIVTTHYEQESRRSPTTVQPPVADKGSLDDPSADNAMMRAFGDALGLPAGSQQ
ncbi:MAG: hypothetical protein ACR2PS_08310 [Pseudomonadales bacterium]